MDLVCRTIFTVLRTNRNRLQFIKIALHIPAVASVNTELNQSLSLRFMTLGLFTKDTSAEHKTY
jgi:hypothetical protein